MAEAETRLPLKVLPSSSKDTVLGWLDASLKIKVKAPPENGKANAAVEKLLSRRLNVPLKAVNITNGHKQPNKVVTIQGLDAEEVKRRLDGGTP